MSQESIKVLLVENDPGFARYISEMLAQNRDFALAVEWVNDLHTGLRVLALDPPDLLLLDLAVPDGAGLANLALIREIAPGIPVIMSGRSDDDIIALEAVHAGAEDYLIKGHLTPAWLESSVRYVIERRRMDLALLHTEERYHRLFDHLVEGIFQTTPQGRYLLANAALARIYGYSSPQELMDTMLDIGRKLYVQEGRRNEFVSLMQSNDTLSDFESQVYRKDGSVIWISENCHAVRDENHRLLYYEGTVEDITQRKQAEEDLRNSEALYHSLVETLPQNIFRKDLQGRFTFANQHFCRSLGRSLEEILGKTDADFFPKDLAEQYQQDDRRVLETGKAHNAIEQHQPPGQGKIYVQVVKTPLYGADGKPIGLQGIFWDITEQVRAEEEIRGMNSMLAQSRKELQTRNLQMEEDLRMAREIQLTMLPQQYPSFHCGKNSAESVLRFTHRYLPTGSVGGDFFSVSALSETEAAVFICDVAGHGVRSSLVTAMIRALVEELKPLATSPGQFLTKLNADLYAILRHAGTPLLTTAFYLVADCQKHTMRYANAGHPKPLWIKRESGTVLPLANELGRSQAALGLFEDANYHTSQAQLSPGDAIMLFTDGLYEVQGEANNLYSQDMLIHSVQRRTQLPAEGLFDELLAEIQKFSVGGFTDDVCLVAMEVSANS